MESEKHVTKSGNVRWYKIGTRMLHRIDGPAYTPREMSQWWINGDYVCYDGDPFRSKKVKCVLAKMICYEG